MGHLGFSYVGFIYLFMLFIPNIIWTKHQPKGYDYRNESKGLLLCERIGQVCVTCCALIFSNFNLTPFSLWNLWLAASFFFMILYEVNWIRYFWGEHTLFNFYRRFCGIPVPGASLPVFAFLLLGIYGKVIWLIIAILIFGIGHIGIQLQHLKEIEIKP